MESELDTPVCRYDRTARGFTLLEILVVVAIVGIFLAVALLSTDFASFDRKLEHEAQRLAAKLKFTSEEALMQSRDFGVVFYEEGYEFLMFEPVDGWLPAGGAGMEALALENDILMQLKLQGLEVELESRCDVFDCAAEETRDDETGDNDDDEDSRSVQPQVILFSSSEATPFELEFLQESEIMELGYTGTLLSMEFDGKIEVGAGDGY